MPNLLKAGFAILLLSFCLPTIYGQSNRWVDETYSKDRFRQMDDLLPTPNAERRASGAPGTAYWQNRADYVIECELNDKTTEITGKETITYHNNSPDELTYIWLQLDQNLYDKNSETYSTETQKITNNMGFGEVLKHYYRQKFAGGYTISDVKDSKGLTLKYTIVRTMMRVDLPTTLKPGGTYTFSLAWKNLNPDAATLGGRGCSEFFKTDNNYIHELALWFPRVCVYNDVNGWQHKQFLGRGEFTLPFGDYKVSITVPADHVVAATGELQQPEKILTSKQMERLNQARKETVKPVLIITPDEAKANEKSHSTTKKTWVYVAKNVRDFAWASSRKFIWDAMIAPVGGKDVLCMSYYPNEGNPIWEKWSTQAVAHTIKVYSKFTIDYPYPVAISVNGPVGGMEYPMICFNGPRPEADGTYYEGTKIGLISVVIHEVGHNFFPMIINSDERQWTWMDEGLNSFVQYLAEQEWSRTYPSRRGPAANIVPYMKGDKDGQEPIMTNSENIIQFGNNAYGKPATALNILRETVLGRELFDFAFKEYCRRWAFRQPTPSDLFRTLEDASGVDLDWFWRGWFFTVDNVDMAIKGVNWYKIDTQNPEVEMALKKAEKDAAPKDVAKLKNPKDIPQTLDEKNPEIKDFYDTYDPLKPNILDKRKYAGYLENLTDEEKELLNKGINLYQIDFENIGGLVMPLILEFTFTDGTKEVQRIPAEVWRQNNKKINKVFIFNKELQSVQLDPNLETADTDVTNNSYPQKVAPNRFQLFKNDNDNMNPMQIQKRVDELMKKN